MARSPRLPWSVRGRQQEEQRSGPVDFYLTATTQSATKNFIVRAIGWIIPDKGVPKRTRSRCLRRGGPINLQTYISIQVWNVEISIS